MKFKNVDLYEAAAVRERTKINAHTYTHAHKQTSTE